MESWRRVWRDGFAPLLSDKALEALYHGLLNDDPRLIQGRTIIPLPYSENATSPVEGACLIGFCGWRGDGLDMVEDVEEFFARMCEEASNLLGEPAACRYLLNPYDEDWTREQMRQLLMPEVRRELEKRKGVAEVA